MNIQHIDAFQIFDSRGNPTLESVVTLENGIIGRGLVPFGASTGQFEAHELRDGDPQVFAGKSVYKAIENVRTEIADALRGYSAADQRRVDACMIALDGTDDKSRLGANSILGVSMAVANAAASARGVPLFESLGGGYGSTLPLPEIQIIGGGAPANRRTDIQDWLIIATGARDYAETLEITFHVLCAAGEIMKSRHSFYGCADEGGYWPEFRSNEEAFDTFAAAGRRKIPSSATWRWQPMLASSKLAPSAAANGWRNGTNAFGSDDSLERKPVFLGGKHWPASNLFYST